MRFIVLFLTFLVTLLFVTPLYADVRSSDAEQRSAVHQAKVKAGVEDPTLSERAKDAAAHATEQIKQAAHTAGVKVGINDPTTADRVSEKAASIKDTLDTAAHKAKVKLGAEKPTVRERAQSAAEEAQKKAGEAKHRAKVATGLEQPTVWDKLNDLHAAAKPHIDTASQHLSKVGSIIQEQFANLKAKVAGAINKQEL